VCIPACAHPSTCIDGVRADQNVTVSLTLSHRTNEAPVADQTVVWRTFGSSPSISYGVDRAGNGRAAATSTGSSASDAKSVVTTSVQLNSAAEGQSSSDTGCATSISAGPSLITPTNFDQVVLWFITLMRSLLAPFA
jgi:hypothetical protein